MGISSMTEISIPVIQMVLLLLLSIGASFFWKAKAGPPHQLSVHPLLGLRNQQGFPGRLRIPASERIHDPLCRLWTDHWRRGPGQSDLRARAKLTHPFHH